MGLTIEPARQGIQSWHFSLPCAGFMLVIADLTVLTVHKGASAMSTTPFSPCNARFLMSAALLLIFGLCAEIQAAGPPRPVKISQAQIAGAIFEDYAPVVETVDGNTTNDVEVFLSHDQKFDTGVYKSGKVRTEITEPYGVNEYMHFIEGGVTLTSSDGTVTEITAGDSVVIPADWTGTWDTEGYTKIYVIYSPDGPIEP